MVAAIVKKKHKVIGRLLSKILVNVLSVKWPHHLAGLVSQNLYIRLFLNDILNDETTHELMTVIIELMCI